MGKGQQVRSVWQGLTESETAVADSAGREPFVVRIRLSDLPTCPAQTVGNCRFIVPSLEALCGLPYGTIEQRSKKRHGFWLLAVPVDPVESITPERCSKPHPTGAGPPLLSSFTVLAEFKF
ncbi:MAG TPA: hypothetical protein VFL47_13615 [Flavisolibacter sp.]|nr:hypothetical protein [Flavisolibacter sp.]